MDLDVRAETFLLLVLGTLCCLIVTGWISNSAGRSNPRDEGRVTIGFKTGSKGLESEAIYTMLEVSASKFDCERKQ